MNRQSSLSTTWAPICLAITGFCMQPAPKCVAWRTPAQGFTGWGAFQRRGPTGGAAKGMPLNIESPPETSPATIPPVTLAWAIPAFAGAAARASSASAAIQMVFTTPPRVPRPQHRREAAPQASPCLGWRQSGSVPA